VKTFIYILITILTLTSQAFGQISISNNISVSDTVNMGMCFIGDSLETIFLITNNTSQAVKISSLDPSFYIGKPLTDGPNEDFREFERISPPLPLVIQPNKSENLIIRYYATTDLVSHPAGIKYSLLKLGLYDAQLPSVPNKEDMLCYKEFILKAKKSILYVDNYKLLNNFDTVYVNPYDTLRYISNYKNMVNKTIKIENESFTYYNSNALTQEFKVSLDNNNPNFILKGEHKSRSFSYYPINRGWDTVIYSVGFKPEPIILPDSVAYSKLILTGYGAEQRLRILNGSGAEFSHDTVYIGDVRLNETKQVKIIFQNRGNLPFGVIGQSILKEIENVNEPAFIFNKFLNTGTHIQVDATDTLVVDFTPDEMRDYTARIRIESDISRRKIFGATENVNFLTFYIKAKATQPRIAYSSDEVDLGEIIVSESCPTEKDTIIKLYNSGNETIKIYNVAFNPNTTNPFKIYDRVFEIEPNSYYDYKLSFLTASVSENSNFNSSLEFYTNSSVPYDTFTLKLKAQSVPLINMDISIPKTIKTKPGTIVSVPIIVEKNKVINANSFSTSLTFNSTILEYDGFDNINTASEATRQISIVKQDESTIKVEINTGIDDFLNKDTLIKIKFNTYIGDEVSSAIAFENTKFANNSCEKIFSHNNIEDNNGLVTIDSVCGLNLKIIKASIGKFRLGTLYPNPVINKAGFEYEIAYPTNALIQVFNSEGQLVKTLIDNYMPKGVYSLDFSTEDLSLGNYIINMKAGRFNKIINMKVCR
jgi:hypothetical protein